MTILSTRGADTFLFSRSEYDLFRAGKMREEICRLWDWSARRYKLVRCYVIDIGKPADVKPADAEAAIRDEPGGLNSAAALPGERPSAAAARERRIQQDQKRLAVLRRLLREKPGLGLTVITRECGIQEGVLKRLLKGNPDLFYFKIGRQHAVWYVRGDA